MQVIKSKINNQIVETIQNNETANRSFPNLPEAGADSGVNNLTEENARLEKPLSRHSTPLMLSTSEGSKKECSTCRESVVKAIPNVYALGRIEVRFPSIGIEKEYAQVMRQSDTGGMTDRQVFHAILSKPENRYLLRKVCWVLSIEGLDTYILQPRFAVDFDLLIHTLRPAPRSTDIDVVIGSLGPIAPPGMCKGLAVPIVVFDQIYSFDVDALVKSIPKPESTAADTISPAAEELFLRIIQLADNAGSSDEHRAINYLAVRYPEIYYNTAAYFARNFSLDAVDVIPSRLNGTRRVFNVVFSYANRTTDYKEKQFVRVDVTEAFPFLVSKMSPYFDR